jgi:hypothetical protein
MKTPKYGPQFTGMPHLAGWIETELQEFCCKVSMQIVPRQAAQTMHHSDRRDGKLMVRRGGLSRQAMLLGCLGIAGCTNLNFVPGPGMLAIDLSPDTARCHMYARGATPGFEFGAYGSAKFVAASTAGAVIGHAIGSAIQQNQDFNDCMQARGWRVADEVKPGTLKPLGATSVVAAATSIATPSSDMVAQMPATVAFGKDQPQARRTLGLAILPMTTNLASDAKLSSMQGLYVVNVMPGGAAESAGLLVHDVILSFDGTSVDRVDDLQIALTNVAHGTVVPVNLWRNGNGYQASLAF